MFVVIFRARVRSLDPEYSRVAARMRELAIGEFGCLGFHAVTEGGEEIALSYWPSEDAIKAWKAHPEHALAQRAGRAHWYESYTVQVAAITREYQCECLGVELRPATLDDLALLRRWDEAPHVLASDPHDDWDWETELARNPQWREQMIAEVGSVPVGFLQIIDPAEEDSHYWGPVAANLRAIDIWIGEERFLGRGFGSEMMRLALQRCFAAPEVQAVLLDPLESNARAHRFYERLGFRAVERRSFGDDDCVVYRLQRSDWAAR